MRNAWNRAGRSVTSTQWPSKGGTGNKLKTASTRLIATIIDNNCGKRPSTGNDAGKKRIIKPNIRAMEILDSGPASATLMGPYFLSRRWRGLYGTGLAEPNTNGVPANRRNNGKSTEPNKSRCLIGLRVRRPIDSAVLSPRERAANPWLTSWMTTE